MRGDGSELPDALLDLVRDELVVAGESLTLIQPRDWAELRHQYGAVGQTAPYWATAWPSGTALAEALADRDLAGARVLELGCGLAVPSLVAARRGARVLATDGSPDAVAFCAHNLALNDCEGEAALADFRASGPLLEGAPWDLVLAADVFYLRDNVEALLRLLPKLIGTTGEAIVADPSRSGGKDFLAAAKAFFFIETTSVPGGDNVNLHRLRRKPPRGGSRVT